MAAIRAIFLGVQSKLIHTESKFDTWGIKYERESQLTQQAVGECANRASRVCAGVWREVLGQGPDCLLNGRQKYLVKGVISF